MIHFHFHVFISLPTLDFIVNFLLSILTFFTAFPFLSVVLFTRLSFVYSSWIIRVALFIMHNLSLGLFTLVLCIFIFLPLSLFAFQAPGVPFPFPPRRPEWSPLMSIQPAVIIIIILFFVFLFIMANIICFQGGFNCPSLQTGLGGNGEFEEIWGNLSHPGDHYDHGDHGEVGGWAQTWVTQLHM